MSAGTCSYCGAPVGFGQTRCNTETCYLRRINELETALGRAERELALLKGKRFPVLSGGMSVPWQMLAPHELQAKANHGQTLQRLAERGGLSWAEMLCVLEGCSWGERRALTDEQAKPKVLAIVTEYEKLGLIAGGQNG